MQGTGWDETRVELQWLETAFQHATDDKKFFCVFESRGQFRCLTSARVVFQATPCPFLARGAGFPTGLLLAKTDEASRDDGVEHHTQRVETSA